MKRLALFCILAFVVHINLLSQSCLLDGIEFWNQDQVDNFQINYPNFSVVEGNVAIKGSNITNLDGLLALNSIEGDLTIGNPEMGGPYLQNMSGLDNLKYIGGSFRIDVSYSINNLVGLENLKEIEGDFLIYYASELTNFLGVDGLSAINGDIIRHKKGFISDNNSTYRLDLTDKPSGIYYIKLVFDNNENEEKMLIIQ